MNMKSRVFLVLALLSALSANCIYGQMNQPLEWSVTVKVVDDSGGPVTGADTWVSYGISPVANQTNDWDKIEGLTDADGEFAASHSDTHSMSLGIHVRKSGYYPTDVVYELGAIFSREKWNPTLTLVLKKILHPIPMYAKRIIGAPAVLNQPLGYDLIAGDWVAPFGKGTNTDIIFTVRKTDNDTEFTITFPNRDDGIQEFHVPFKITEGSALRSPYEAPEDGYQSQLTRKSNDYDESRCYFFRVRTASNTRALYGKIYGDPMSLCYYLNPEPNSRNVEFDPKKNLIKKFRLFAERVNAP